ncbi:MAG: D-Lactate dehydrogenase, cytochrome c-dependent, partial [uncultured Sphingomonadaceae bacterium]
SSGISHGAKPHGGVGMAGTEAFIKDIRPRFGVRVSMGKDVRAVPGTGEAGTSLESGRAAVRSGTGTGEHGIGLGKQGKLIDELGEGAVALMRGLKRAIDPAGLMNPGKIFADAADAAG